MANKEDLHNLWPHRWISPKTKSYESPIQGLGLIATENIILGKTILIYGGIIVPKSNIVKYRSQLGHIGIQIDDNFFICPTSREELGKTGIVNHSCNPNVGFKSSVELIAIDNVNSNDELVLDYAFMESYFEPFKCNCGSTNCRGTITQDDWKIKEIQEKYGRYFSPYLKSKINRQA